VGSDIARYEARCKRLYGDSSAARSQFQRGQQLQGVLHLEAATAERFCADELPQYFGGDLDASFVLVHLNPMQHDAEWARSRPEPGSFEKYVSAQRVLR
jgi:hypothetical protein